MISTPVQHGRKSHRQMSTRPRSRRRLLALLVATVGSVSAISVSTALPAQAIDYNCANADSRPNPNSNNTDRCLVYTGDRDVQFVGTFKVADYCTSSGVTYNQTRVRVVASWVANGRKLLIKSVGIRYLTGTKPWAAYSIQVLDGNGVYYRRPWNNNGDPLDGDPAQVQRLGDDVTSVNASAGFAPPFGANNSVNLQFKAYFYNTHIAFPGQQACQSDGMALRFQPV